MRQPRKVPWAGDCGSDCCEWAGDKGGMRTTGPCTCFDKWIYAEPPLSALEGIDAPLHVFERRGLERYRDAKSGEGGEVTKKTRKSSTQSFLDSLGVSYTTDLSGFEGSHMRELLPGDCVINPFDLALVHNVCAEMHLRKVGAPKGYGDRRIVVRYLPFG